MNFSLCNSTLGGKSIKCAAIPNDKEVLAYDESLGKWVPKNVNSLVTLNGLLYKGTWDALNDYPEPTGTYKDYYIVSEAGNGYSVGDSIIHNGTGWDKIGSSIQTVFGRAGTIIAQEADYDFDQLSDVDTSTTAPTAGNFLKYDGSDWVPGIFPTCGSTQVLKSDGTSLSCVTVSPGTGSAFSGNANRAVITDGSGALTISSVTATEIGYVSGVTSSIQTQITNIAATAGATSSNTITSALTSGNIIVGNGSNVATSVAMSGDATIANTGALTIAADSVALTTDTAGNYVTNITASSGLQATAAAGEGTTPNLVLGGTLTGATTFTQGTHNVLFDITSTGTFSILAGATGLSVSDLGITTVASSVLTTTDINGGTIDGTTVGAAVPSTGNFTKIGIGIGAATPSVPLEVLGNASITGVLSNLVSPTAATDAATKGYVDAGCGMQGAFKNLKIINGTTEDTDIAVTADAECLSDGTRYVRANNVSLNIQSSNAVSCVAGTINCLDTGAIANSTWYSIWVISNGTTVAGLLSTSATAPTMPAGYVYKARVGWTRTDGSANLLRTIQVGRRAQYRVISGVSLPIMASGATGDASVPTWTSISLTNYVPSTAGVIRGIMVKDINATMIIAPNSDHGAYNSTSNPSAGGSSSSNNNIRMPFEFVIEVANTMYWASDSASNEVAAFGWEDNL